jgi:hypothetical protein
MTAFAEAYENAAVRELAVQWRFFNKTIFANSLKTPTMQLHSGVSRLGFWDRQHRMISISEDILLEKPWFRILTILQHEMVHQFIDEVMQCPESQPHGELFKSVCEKFGIEQKDDLGEAAEVIQTPVLEKIRKLLSLAQSSNVHESETAMKMANDLMLKWNIKNIDQNKSRNYKFDHVGEVGRVSLLQKMISQILLEYFFVEAIWVQSYDVKKNKKGRVLEICGCPENLEIAKYVYDYLITVARYEWDKYKKNHVKANRNNYQYGLMLGFLEKLKGQEKEHNEDVALVWVGDPLLDEYFRKRHPRVRRMSQSSLQHHEQSLKDGRKDGKRIVISKGLYGESKGTKGFLNS